MAWDPATYGERFAAVYDDWYPAAPLDTAAALDTLAALAGEGPVLELGAGTGRLAIPLAARGLAVCALDASRSMLQRLRVKPGGERVPVVVADMARPAIRAGRFRLVFVACNTFLLLADEDRQRRCVAAAAAALAPGGRLVVETEVLADDAPAEGVSVRRVEPDRVQLHVFRADGPVVDTSIVDVTEAGIRLYPARLRRVSPTELDAMAVAAGLELEARWGGWDRSAFTPDAERHVSVYVRTPPTGSRHDHSSSS